MGACTMYFVFNTMINKDTEFPYILYVFVHTIYSVYFSFETANMTWMNPKTKTS
jgi:hypothetical protein